MNSKTIAIVKILFKFRWSFFKIKVHCTFVFWKECLYVCVSHSIFVNHSLCTMSVRLLSNISYNRPLYRFWVNLCMKWTPHNNNKLCWTVWKFRIILPFELSHCKLLCGSAMATQTFVSDYCIGWMPNNVKRPITIDFHLTQSNTLDVDYSCRYLCGNKTQKKIVFTKIVLNAVVAMMV